jgi:hypothetical protein
MGISALIVGVAFLSGCTLFPPVNICEQQHVLYKIPLDLPGENTHLAAWRFATQRNACKGRCFALNKG